MVCFFGPSVKTLPFNSFDILRFYWSRSSRKIFKSRFWPFFWKRLFKRRGMWFVWRFSRIRHWNRDRILVLVEGENGRLFGRKWCRSEVGTPVFEVLSVSSLSNPSFKLRSMVSSRLAGSLRWLRKSTQNALVSWCNWKSHVLRRSASPWGLRVVLGVQGIHSNTLMIIRRFGATYWQRK